MLWTVWTFSPQVSKPEAPGSRIQTPLLEPPRASLRHPFNLLEISVISLFLDLLDHF